MSKGKTRKTDKHHFRWPRKLYERLGIRNRTIELPYDVHHSYHSHFMSRCKVAKLRPCRKGYCRYQNICCYCRRSENYGEPVI